MRTRFGTYGLPSNGRRETYGINGKRAVCRLSGHAVGGFVRADHRLSRDLGGGAHRPIPFTLQMFAITFAIVVLSPKEAIAAITGYWLLGARWGCPCSRACAVESVFWPGRRAALWGYLFGAWRLPRCSLYAVRAAQGGRRQEMRRGACAEKARRGPTRGAPSCAASGWKIVAGVIFDGYRLRDAGASYMVVGQVDLATAFLTAVASRLWSIGPLQDRGRCHLRRRRPRRRAVRQSRRCLKSSEQMPVGPRKWSAARFAMPNLATLPFTLTGIAARHNGGRAGIYP